MKMEAKRSVIEIDDDDDEAFFSLAVAAEADLLASKRRRITTLSSTTTAVEDNSDGLYMAALKGNHSVARSGTATDPLRARNDHVTGGGGGGDSCFKCGKSGHWARDCESGGGGVQFGNAGSGSVDSSIAEKSCPCGLGICLVLTANTDKNRGRKFYKCPLRQENGGCGFFEWSDSSSGSNSVTGTYGSNYSSGGTYGSDYSSGGTYGKPGSNSSSGGTYGSDYSSYSGLDCPCGAGLCLILTAKTGNNIGHQFYRCPSNQGSSCGFFKWCSENTQSPRLPVTATKVVYNSTDTNSASFNLKTGSSSSSSCFKCGKQGHWARDCPAPSSNAPPHLGERSGSSGTCYKCGKSGHWSRDCTLT